MSNNCQVYYHYSFVFKVVTAVLNFYVPVLILIYTNIKIYLLIRKRGNNLKYLNQNAISLKNSSLRAKTKNTKFSLISTYTITNLKDRPLRNLFLLVICFIACFFPYFTSYIIVAYCKDCISENQHKFTIWLGYLNSTFNPFIYALCKKEEKKFKTGISSVQSHKKLKLGCRYVSN